MPQKEEAFFRLILRYAIVSLVIMLAILAVAALLVTGGFLPIEHSVAIVILAEAAGTFCGGLRAAKRAAGRKLPAAAVTGILVFIVLLIAGFLFAFPPARHGLFVLLAAVVPALAGGFASQRKKRASHH